MEHSIKPIYNTKTLLEAYNILATRMENFDPDQLSNVLTTEREEFSQSFSKRDSLSGKDHIDSDTEVRRHYSNIAMLITILIVKKESGNDKDNTMYKTMIRFCATLPIVGFHFYQIAKEMTMNQKIVQLGILESSHKPHKT